MVNRPIYQKKGKLLKRSNIILGLQITILPDETFFLHVLMVTCFLMWSSILWKIFLLPMHLERENPAESTDSLRRWVFCSHYLWLLLLNRGRRKKMNIWQHAKHCMETVKHGRECERSKQFIYRKEGRQLTCAKSSNFDCFQDSSLSLPWLVQ